VIDGWKKCCYLPKFYDRLTRGGGVVYYLIRRTAQTFYKEEAKGAQPQHRERIRKLIARIKLYLLVFQTQNASVSFMDMTRPAAYSTLYHKSSLRTPKDGYRSLFNPLKSLLSFSVLRHTPHHTYPVSYAYSHSGFGSCY
jgi:hypothetical protein